MRAGSPTRRSRSTTTRPSGRRVFELGGRWTVPLVLIDGEPVGGYRELARPRPRPGVSPSGSPPSVSARRRSEQLAARAERRRAAADDDPLERRPAPVARLAAATVGAELVLHRPVGAVGKRVVAQRRPLALDPACGGRAGPSGAAAPARRRRGSLPGGVDAAARTRGPRRRRCSRARRPSAGRAAPT